MELALVALLAPRIWRWLLDFMKICGPMIGYVAFVDSIVIVL
jgi:hypothetical protein